MSIRYRAMLSVRYFWKRNVVIGLIYVGIFAAFFISFLSWTSSKDQINYLQKYLGNSITITKVSQQAPALFSEQDLETIRKVDSVSGLNILTTDNFLLKNIKPYVLDEASYKEKRDRLENTLSTFGIEDSKTDCRIFAVTDSEKMPFFTGSGFELVQGRPITQADKSEKAALVSADLAALNKLHLGDEITVSLDPYRISLGMNGEEVSLKIIGFFTAPDLQQSGDWPDEYPANYIFVPERFLNDVYRFPAHIVYAYSRNDEITQTVEQLKSVLKDGTLDPNGTPAMYEYKWDEEWAATVSRPLMEVNRLTFTIMIMIGLVMMILTALLSALLIYKRRYEYYIYRSRGESKARIILQSLTEYLLIIVLSSFLSFALAVSIQPAIASEIMKPYVALSDTYLQEYKDKQELAEKTEAVVAGLYENAPTLRNPNQKIPLRIDTSTYIILLLILYGIIPCIFAAEIGYSIRGDDIHLDASSERS